MATFTLDSLRDTVSAKYAPTIIEDGDDKFVLTNMLQLPEKRRNKVFELSAAAENMDDAASAGEAFKMFEEIILAVVEDDRGQELLDRVGDNSAILTEIFTQWSESSQVGEA